MSLDLDQQINKLIDISQNILLLGPDNCSGDCLASILAYYSYLTKQKKKKSIDFILPQKPKKIYSFLPSFNDIQTKFSHLRRLVFSIDTKNTYIEKIGYKREKDKFKIFISPGDNEIKVDNVEAYYSNYYDLIIIFNSQDLKSLGKIFTDYPDFFYQTPIINIDNKASNEHYGQINFVDLNVNSFAEQLYNFFNRNNIIIDNDIATCFLTGLISATRAFSNQKVTSKTLEIAGKLIDLGADRKNIVSALYQTKSISLLKTWGQILSELDYDSDYKIVWSVLRFNDDDSNEQLDIDDLISELISQSEQAEIVVLFQIVKTDLMRVHIYSNYKYNSYNLIKGLVHELDTIGNEDLLTYEIKGVVDEVKYRVLNTIKENIRLNRI